MRINRLFFVFYVAEQVARYSCEMNNPLTSISINSKKLTVILTFYILSSAKNKKRHFLSKNKSVHYFVLSVLRHGLRHSRI